MEQWLLPVTESGKTRRPGKDRVPSPEEWGVWKDHMQEGRAWESWLIKCKALSSDLRNFTSTFRDCGRGQET